MILILLRLNLNRLARYNFRLPCLILRPNHDQFVFQEAQVLPINHFDLKDLEKDYIQLHGEFQNDEFGNKRLSPKALQNRLHGDDFFQQDAGFRDPSG